MPRGRHALRFLGIKVCLNAFRRLLGLGQSRFARIWKAEKTGEAVPRDKRFIKRAKAFKKVSPNRELVFEFLQELYDCIAEPFPESHGSVCRVKGLDGAQDPKPLKFRKHRGRRPKLVAKEGRNQDTSAMKMLPPGTYTSYLNMLRARHAVKPPISLKLFTSASWLKPLNFR